MIRALRDTDRGELLRMRLALWPGSQESEVDALLGRLDADDAADGPTVLVAERPDGTLCAFVEFDSRKYAEGCVTSPVAYLEGIWVDPDVRRAAVGSTLVEHAMTWARDQGFTEFASDCDIDNLSSESFHHAVGFAEAGRVVCFRHDLRSETSEQEDRS